MIAGVIKCGLENFGSELEKVNADDEHSVAVLDVTDDGFEFVAPVAVDDDETVNALC